MGINLDGIQFRSISEVDNEMICRMFSEQEILEDVGNCESSKSLGLDGFNFHFIKSNWEIVGPDIIRAVYCFQNNGYILHGCNASFITLIPKKENPYSLNEFRPISLVGCVYKIISKLLANRLKRVSHNVIDKQQSAFLSGRGLLYSVLVANETLDFLKKDKKKGVIVKVDYEKTYDSVDWEFLVYMMGRLGFNNKWIHWIKVCLESTTISVLVNGSPTKQFKPKKGLRQGDPLAPFLFLIVVEGLAGLVRAAVSNDIYEGVEVGLKRIEVNLLQFADDILFFCQPTYKCIMVIKTILCCFELVSGLKVNFHKSNVSAIGIDDIDLSIFAGCLNCSKMHLPFKYLGLFVGGNHKRVSF